MNSTTLIPGDEILAGMNAAAGGPGIVFAAGYKDAHWLLAASHGVEQKLRHKTFKGHSRSLSRDTGSQAVIPQQTSAALWGALRGGPGRGTLPQAAQRPPTVTLRPGLS